MREQETDNASTFEAARARLLALAYRMLGSRAEAEDVMQDVWLKWHAADTREVHTPLAWLTTITTRAAIDRLRHLQRERATQTAPWLPEWWLDETAPSAEELALRSSQMSYGLMLMLERLKPDERAAFVLHEGFDCDYAEIARILDRTPASCRQIVHRAKERLQRAGEPLQRPEPAAHARLVERLRTALEERDTVGLLALFGDAPQVVTDLPEPLSRPVNEPVVEPANKSITEPVAATTPHETVAMLASFYAEAQVDRAEPMWLDGAQGVALLRDGEIVALLDVTQRAGQMTALRLITNGTYLMAANRIYGLSAVRRLLMGVSRRTPRALVAMCGNFPVDIDA
ncbi:sigma-70 family RNA polymerase sigma factor [Paraburkholderia sp. DHOC27]|uniref:sigma-70 family RNA polymerase sigma factor n=1 Tax=Paraburkholderia sp. DHOC27 TaxID=2303330 RepID=UPI000E3D92E6|nr:sigma-70 family RNA polymerase sigma factor [Paraburkholderia sp. DHOC27]RFU46384.1 sigma-70 family RNA polymerase sigma factor [Paraburkholderia sp. DHOC27]